MDVFFETILPKFFQSKSQNELPGCELPESSSDMIFSSMYMTLTQSDSRIF